MYILVGLVFFGLYYGIFRFLIKLWNLRTIGREDSGEVKLYSKSEYQEKVKGITPDSVTVTNGDNGNADVIVAALGGKENIKTVENCYTRLRLTLVDPTKVEEAILKNETGASGIITKGENVQVVYDLNVTQVRRAVDAYLGNEPHE
ncbi:glucose PTS transporter subunit EIIB [Jeotgalibaca porci]|uniref:glucose PTS transporter subunit EIIB n=1 Tax=Jeotgalibaca porci TaxID=1868793 RepID=UPI00359F1E91